MRSARNGQGLYLATEIAVGQYPGEHPMPKDAKVVVFLGMLAYPFVGSTYLGYVHWGDPFWTGAPLWTIPLCV